MRHEVNFTKNETIVVLLCVFLLVTNIGAIDRTGRRRAKEMVCLSNLHQWGTIFQMFTNDNEGYFNGGWNLDGTESWMNVLRPYYKDNWALLVCPEAANTNMTWGTFAAWQRSINLPEIGQHYFVGSYGINSWTNNVTADRGQHLEEWFWKSVHSIKGKDNIPVFLDSTWPDSWPLTTDAPPEFDGQATMGGFREIAHFCINRHNGSTNSLFMDWSARKIGLKELWTLKWHRNYTTEGPWTKAGGVQPYDWPQWMRNFKDY
jgi:prepilin-type processing-associated H-X9-DG protein